MLNNLVVCFSLASVLITVLQGRNFKPITKKYLTYINIALPLAGLIVCLIALTV